MSSTSNLKPLTLHAHSTGPNPYKVALLLTALNIPYDVKLWDFSDSASGVKGKAFTAINPNGRVPALEDPNTGITSWESMACMNYLLRVYDKEGRFAPRGDGDLKRAVEVDEWTSFLVSTLGPMLGQCNWFRHYHASKNDDAYARYKAQAERCLGVLEQQLASHGGEWVLDGKDWSVVDMHFEPWVRQTGFAGLELGGFPKVKAWLEKVQGREEVAKGYESVKKGKEM